LHPDAQRWNARYDRERDYYLQRPPYQLVESHADLLPERGLALDVAAGVSPLGLFLTQRGLQVIALDVSMTALRMAQRRFREQGRSLACAAVDLTDPWLPPAQFDVILDFYFLSRPLLDRFRTALKPGGLLFCELLLWDEQTGSHRRNYLDPGELESRFRDWKTIYSKERWKRGRDPAIAPRRIVQLVVQKPSASEGA
jgi:tellurite methyltransferase